MGAVRKFPSGFQPLVLAIFLLLTIRGDAAASTAPAEPVLTAEEEAELAALMEDD